MILAFIFAAILGTQVPVLDFEKTYEKTCVEAAWKRAEEKAAGDASWVNYFIYDEVANCPKVK